MDRIDIMQSQNFEFLRDTWPELASLAGFAERYVQADPQSAHTKLRNFAERCVDIVYSELSLPRTPLSKFIELLSNDAFAAVTPKVVIDKLHAIRIHGNKAAHGDPVTEQSAQWLLKEAFDLGRWLFITYNNGDIATINAFEQPKPPQSAKADYKNERKALLEHYAKQEAQMQALLAELTAERGKATKREHTEAELTQLKQKAAFKGQQVVNELHFDESTTRKQLIDLQLAQAGWEIDNTHQVTLEEKVHYQPTPSGEGYADYVLWDDNGKPLAVQATGTGKTRLSIALTDVCISA